MFYFLRAAGPVINVIDIQAGGDVDDVVSSGVAAISGTEAAVPPSPVSLTLTVSLTMSSAAPSGESKLHKFAVAAKVEF